MHFLQMIVSKRCSSPHREQGLLIFSSNECSIFRITVWQATGNKTAPNSSGFLINSYLNSKMKDIKGQMSGASLFHPNSCASSDWRHAAAHVELYIAFPLWHLFCGISTRSTSEEVTQTHENQPQILSDQSVRLNAAQRWAKRVHTNRVKGVIIRRANSQSSFFPPIHDGNFFKIHTLKTTGVFSAYIPVHTLGAFHTETPDTAGWFPAVEHSQPTGGRGNAGLTRHEASLETLPEIPPWTNFPACHLNMAVLIPKSQTFIFRLTVMAKHPRYRYSR